MKYTRITENGFSKARLIESTDDMFAVSAKNRDVPWFYSTFHYTEDHKETFDSTNSVAGIRDVTTNLLYWDFDSRDIEVARQSALSLVDRLKNEGFQENQIQIVFSGNKGFHVKIPTNSEMNPKQVEKIAHYYAGDLVGFDESMYDSNQVFRIPLTKHEKSKLYCVPITYNELMSYSLDQFKSNAQDITGFDLKSYREYYSAADIPENVVSLIEGITSDEDKKGAADATLDFDYENFDISSRPKYIDEARWLLMNGFFRGSQTTDVGERNYAFLCLASTYRNIGYNKDVVLGMLKGVAETQAKRTGEDPFTDYELESNIIEQVYSETWKGGQFSIRDPDSWLYKYAKRMGVSLDQNESEPPMRIDEVGPSFEHFVKNINKNTIKTGIDVLDRDMPITIGSSVGILGAASSGKTALALEILKNTSQAGVITVFASLDMHRNRLFEKLLYKETGMKRDEIYHKFQSGEGHELVSRVKKNYGNVWFYDKSAANVESIKNYVKKVEATTGEKVKLVMVDYFERVNSEYSDDTAASKKIANELQDMMVELDIALITLVQPNKFSLGGGPDKPLLSYTSIKGSSFLYQAFRSIVSLWRPFFRADLKEHDNYMQMAILKNDLGELGTYDFSWSGRQGEIKPLEDIQRQELAELLKMKERMEKGEKDADPWA